MSFSFSLSLIAVLLGDAMALPKKLLFGVDTATKDPCIIFNAHVMGCDGTWSGGINYAEDICPDGYHICEDETEASFKGLTSDECSGISVSIPNRSIYVSKQSSNGMYDCFSNVPLVAKNNDLFGCASLNGFSSQEYGSSHAVRVKQNYHDAFKCGIFNAALGNFDWGPWKDIGINENASEEDVNVPGSKLYNIVHEKLTVSKKATGNGGVLCCEDAN